MSLDFKYLKPPWPAVRAHCVVLARFTLNAFSFTNARIRSRRSLVVFVASNTWWGRRNVWRMVEVHEVHWLVYILWTWGSMRTHKDTGRQRVEDSQRSDPLPPSGKPSRPAELPGHTAFVCVWGGWGGESTIIEIYTEYKMIFFCSKPQFYPIVLSNQRQVKFLHILWVLWIKRSHFGGDLVRLHVLVKEAHKTKRSHRVKKAIFISVV